MENSAETILNTFQESLNYMGQPRNVEPSDLPSRLDYQQQAILSYFDAEARIQNDLNINIEPEFPRADSVSNYLSNVFMFFRGGVRFTYSDYEHTWDTINNGFNLAVSFNKTIEGEVAGSSQQFQNTRRRVANFMVRRVGGIWDLKIISIVFEGYGGNPDVKLTINTDPADARLYVNDTLATKSYVTTSVAPGEYTIRAEAAGFISKEKTIVLSEGVPEYEVDLVLEPVRKVLLTVTVEPSSATVFLNDESYMNGLVNVALDPGVHRVRAENVGFTTKETSIILPSGIPNYTTTIELDPEVQIGKNVEYYVSEGVRLQEVGQYDQAISNFEYCNEIAPSNYSFCSDQLVRTESMKSIGAWKLAAGRYMQDSRYVDANPLVNNIIDLFPNDADAKRWQRKLDVELPTYRYNGRLTYRKDRFSFRELSLIESLIKDSDTTATILARNMSGPTIQAWFGGVGLAGIKVSIFTPDHPAVDLSSENVRFPIQTMVDADFRVGGYPYRSEWGSIALFVGVGATFIAPAVGDEKVITTVPAGFSLQVFPFRYFVLPTQIPRLPLAQIGLEYTFAYSWSPSVVRFGIEEPNAFTDKVVFSRIQQGFGLVWRYKRAPSSGQN